MDNDQTKLVIIVGSAAGYAKTLLIQLDWWARALRSARAAVPYPGGA